MIYLLSGKCFGRASPMDFIKQNEAKQTVRLPKFLRCNKKTALAYVWRPFSNSPSPRECVTEGGTYNYFCFVGKEFPIKKYNSSKQNKTVQCTITLTVGAIKLLQTSSSLYGSHQGHAVCILQVTSHGKTVGKSCNLYPQRL